MNIDEELLSFDIRSSDELIPKKSDYHQCMIFELPQLNEKHHIVRVIVKAQD